MNTTKQVPNYGTYALLLAVAGLGGWALHEAIGGEPPLSPASAAPAVDRGQVGAQPPINLTVVPAAPPPRGHAKGRPRDVPASSPLVAGTVTGQPTLLAAATPPPGSSQLPLLVLVSEGTGGGGRSHPGEPANQTTSNHSPSTIVLAPQNDSYQVLATQGSIVYIGDDGHLIGNTGPTASSGVVALGVDDSTLQTGASNVEDGQLSSPTNQGSAAEGGNSVGADPSHANSSFAILMPGAGTAGSGTAISGFEDHSVSVIGNDQIVTYDDSNVLIDRDGLINTNTGDTDSSGLNAVDVVGSYVGSGNSGDGEGDSEDEEVEEEEASPEAQLLPAAVERASRESSDDEDGSGDDEADEDAGIPSAYPALGPTYATVTDEGASIASGAQSFVVGADGYDDVSIRSRGDRNIVTYDDSNVVIGGTGKVNAQIGDSDTGGAVVMGILNSHVQAGCEGDLCYSD